MTSRILMIVSSTDRLPGTERPTGVWAEELAAPYRIFEEAGFTIDLASPNGGTPPIDPMSTQQLSPLVEAFLNDPTVQQHLAATKHLDDVAATYDAAFVVGGYGVMWDLFKHRSLAVLLSQMLEHGKFVAAVCHGAVVLADVVDRNGISAVQGQQVTGFSNAEEDAVGIGVELPALVEDALKQAGGVYGSATQIFTAHTVRSGQILTGQNPQSSEQLAHDVVAALSKQREV